MKPDLDPIKRTADLGQLKRKTDLAMVAESRGLKLIRQGQDWVALCPFHPESSPSFHSRRIRISSTVLGVGLPGA